MNMIVIAVLCLVVLITAIVIFTGKAGIFSKSIDQTCADQNGVCLYTSNADASCSDDKPVKTIAKGCRTKSDSEANIGPCCIPSPLG